ncbi:MAG: HAD-IB family phosphatase [Coriobacteriales bacterium]|nr:HAD-IB family phosphatase [Coriobacteriales bacterium]
MIKVAAFDLDGTVLDGESPFILTKRLFRDRDLRIHTALLMGWWGIRYRLRLPQTETTPRELLFGELTEPTVKEVDDEILKIYKKKIRKKIKVMSRFEIQKLKDKNYQIILASASFKPITDEIVKELDFDGQVSTVLEEKNGHYTGKVVGLPVQGKEKLSRLISYCDGAYGKGKWKLKRAYSDHFSDLPLLDYADIPICVDADRTLTRIAKRNNWKMVKWDKKLS